ncbi:MAG: extracellular solute-binding protein [Lachnospiraceae bacterium]|nr:extracellular solute-binding protein [Lachnospiraceae bacterium]
MLAGCKKESGVESASDEVEKKYTYTGAAPVTDTKDAKVSILATNSWYTTVDLKEATIVKEVQKRAGVNVDWTLISPTNYTDTVSPMLAAGKDLPDIVLLPDLDPNMTYINSGLFVKLDEYMDYMPNYKKFLEENPTIKSSLTAQDGHIYYVPLTSIPNNYQPCMMYNLPWIEKLGIDQPTTLDEFVEMLRMFRDNDMNGNGDPSDEIPMSVTSSFLPYMFGPAFGLDLVSGFYADDAGKVHYAYAESEDYKDYLAFLNGLYEEGLLEVEFTSLTRDQITERCAQDLTGVTFDYSWQMSTLYSAQYPQYDGTTPIFCGVAPLSGKYEGYYVGRNAVNNIFGVTSGSDNILLAVKFLDYSMGEECQDLYVWGIEGETYVVNADGSRSYTEQAKDNMWFQAYGVNPVCYPSQQSIAGTDVLLAKWHADVDKELVPFVKAPWPFIYATQDEADTVSQYLVDITTYAEEMNVAFITGTEDLANFDTYISTLDSMQMPKILEIRQNQYNRYLEASK